MEAYTLKSLKDDIISQTFTAEEIFQRHIVDGNAFFFRQPPQTPGEEYKFKSLIANSLNININQVVIVGSAKLGFSLNPTRLFKPFDYLYNDTEKPNNKSDIDVAIISHNLFERLSQEIFDYTDSFSKQWDSTVYHKSNSFEVPLNFKYYEYFSKGWFRPDLKPNGYEFCTNGSYQDLKGIIYRKYKRRVALGIYKDWHYFKSYHIKTINKLILKSKHSPL